jgi:FkbM family methyltransferase
MSESVTRAFQTRHGPMIGLRGDRYVSGSLDLYGEYCPAELDALMKFVKPGDTVVEAGANIGTHTVPLARACAPGRLYAFEPQQRVFQILCANLALNNIGNVIARPEAVGAETGSILVPDIDYARPGNFGAVSLEGPQPDSGTPTPLTTLDSLQLPACALIKIDVEGFEPQALRGAAETIARCRPFLYVENDRVAHQQENISLMAEMGYRLYWHTPSLFSPDNFRQTKENVFAGIASLNMLGVPRERGINIEGLVEIDPDNWTSPLRVG